MKPSHSPLKSSADASSEELRWARDWEVAVRIWIQRRGNTVLGEALADVLQAIDQTHSISAAARALGISYRHAWKLVQDGNDAAGEPLVTAEVGGVQGGGARLTPRGRQAQTVFEALRGKVRESAASLLQRTVHPPLDLAATVHVAAAVSLQEVVGQILAEFALKQPSVRVRAIYGASNELADHVLAGAPCDLFISADPVHLDRLASERRLLDKSRAVVAVNTLVAIGGENASGIASPGDLAKAAHVVLADPQSPLGKWSRAYLEKAGLYEALAGKTIFVDNSGAILTAIRSGQADAGLAFASDLSKVGGERLLFQVDAADASIVYSAGVCRGEREADAQQLLEFLRSPEGERCFRRCGFGRPPAVEGKARARARR